MRYMYLNNQGDTEMNAYEAAYNAHNEALEIFRVARAKFYAIPGIASEADFAEFAAAQAAKKEADAIFDAAYDVEMNREEEVEIVDDGQIEMFA